MKRTRCSLAAQPEPSRGKPEALVYREPWCAQGYEEDRYGGRFGQVLKAHEIDLFTGLLGGEKPGMTLDAGAGTGKLTIALLERGWKVASIDFSLEMLRIGKWKISEIRRGASFCVSDLQDLCFRDQAFECTVSSRVLMHLADWKRGLSELCRVTRRTLVLDVPARFSFAGMESFVRRRLGLKSPSDAPAYEAFTLGGLTGHLEMNGFSVSAVHRSYCLPVSLHRWLDRPELTRKVESLLARIGLTRWFGNPITIKAARNGTL